MTGENDPLDETVRKAAHGEGRQELDTLREKLRWVAAFAFIGGIALNWHQGSDLGLFMVLAAILVLLGERGAMGIFERWINK